MENHSKGEGSLGDRVIDTQTGTKIANMTTVHYYSRTVAHLHTKDFCKADEVSYDGKTFHLDVCISR